MKTLSIFLALGMSLSVSAFARGGSSTVGVGNPASQNCVKLGGNVEIVDTPEGQYGNCAIEEWTLWREMDERGLVKHHDYNNGDGAIGMPNPASVNCLDVGGQLSIVDGQGGQYGICKVEEWALFRIINVLDEGKHRRKH